MHEHLDCARGREAGPADGLSWLLRQSRRLCCRRRPRRRRRCPSSPRQRQTVRHGPGAGGIAQRRRVPSRESRRRSSTWTTSTSPRTGQDQVNTWGLELAPGFYASYSSGSVTAAIDYSVIGRAWDDSDYNDVSQQGAANGRWIAVPDLFYIDAQGSISDSVIESAAGLELRRPGHLWRRQSEPAGDGRHHSDLRQAIRRFQPAGPVLLRPRLVLRRRQRREPGRASSARTTRGTRAPTSPSATQESGRKLTGDVFYNWQKSDYDNALPYNYEQLGADLAWQFTPSTALVGAVRHRERPRQEHDAGRARQQLLGRGAALGAGRPHVRRGALRRALLRHTYFLNARRTARMFEFTASYTRRARRCRRRS